MPETVDLCELSPSIASRVRERLTDRLTEFGTLVGPQAVSSLHTSNAIDHFAAEAATDALAGKRCNVYVRGQVTGFDPYAPAALYIAPVTSTIAWDRRIGDPAFVMAWTAGPAASSLEELAGAYVEGLISGDRYWADYGQAFYRCWLTGRTVGLGHQGPQVLEQATGYLPCPSGSDTSVMAITFGLLASAGEVHEARNTAIELCQIARGAAGFMVQGGTQHRDLSLLSWPILRAVGGDLLKVDGTPLAEHCAQPDKPAMFIAAASSGLANQVVERIHQTRELGTQVVGLVYGQ